MRKKVPYGNTKRFQLSRIGIISYDFKNENIIIDTKKLFLMDDNDILKYRGVGPAVLKQINQTREELKQLLFQNQ